MEISINVDESMFKDVLDKELKALKPEELHEVLIQCIKEYFSKDDYVNLRKLIIKEDKDRWGYTSRTTTAFTEKLIKDCDYSSLQDFVDKAVEELKNNYTTILKDIIAECIVSGLYNNYQFQSNLKTAVASTMADFHNNR